MDREIPHNEERPTEGTEMERRRGVDAMHDVTPEIARERAEIVYGDTDMNPNADDQRSAHHAETDEHL